MLFKMAFRNVFRNFKRSLLSITTIVVGVMGFILAYGMARGVEDTILRIDIDTDFGHLRVANKRYKKEETTFPLDIQVEKPVEIVTTIKKKWPKATVFQRLIFAVDLGDGIHKLRCRGVALPASAAEKAYQFSKYGQKKQVLVEGENSIYLGSDLAKTFEKKVGESLTLLVRTQAGSMNAIDFTIRDILGTGNMLVDGNSVYMSMSTGRRLLQMPRGATDVIARLPKEKQSVLAAALVQKSSSKNFPRTWQDKSKEIAELQKLDRQFYDIMILIIMIVAGIGIANTLLMSGYERQGEIGMMLAQGMRPSPIMKMFAMEAGVLGFLGSSIGAFVGGGIALYYKTYGLVIPGGEAIGSEITTMSFSTTIYLSVDVPLIASAILIGIGIAIVGSLWPAWRFSRMEPLEAITGS